MVRVQHLIPIASNTFRFASSPNPAKKRWQFAQTSEEKPAEIIYHVGKQDCYGRSFVTIQPSRTIRNGRLSQTDYDRAVGRQLTVRETNFSGPLSLPQEEVFVLTNQDRVGFWDDQFKGINGTVQIDVANSPLRRQLWLSLPSNLGSKGKIEIVGPIAELSMQKLNLGNGGLSEKVGLSKATGLQSLSIDLTTPSPAIAKELARYTGPNQKTLQQLELTGIGTKGGVNLVKAMITAFGQEVDKVRDKDLVKVLKMASTLGWIIGEPMGLTAKREKETPEINLFSQGKPVASFSGGDLIPNEEALGSTQKARTILEAAKELEEEDQGLFWQVRQAISKHWMVQ